MPAQAQPHPHLFFDQADVERAKARMDNEEQSYAGIAQGIILSASRLLERDIPFFERQGAWSHFFICDGIGDGNDDPNDGCGGSLLYDEFSPHEHLCPRCGTVYRGDPYDRAWISFYRKTVANHFTTLGLAYLLTDHLPFAQKARDIFMRYVRLYPTLEAKDLNGGKAVGRAKLFSHTLEESMWMMTSLWGLSAIWNSPPLSETDKTLIEEDLLDPLVSVIAFGDWGHTNIQAWISSTIGSIGFFLEDDFLIDLSIDGYRGFHFLMDNSFMEDGFSFEGSIGYHYFTVLPMVQLVLAAEQNGRPLWSERFKQALTAPLSLVQPNGDFPRYNDSGRTRLIYQRLLYELANGVSDDPVFDRVLTELYHNQGRSRANHQALFAGEDYQILPFEDFLNQTPKSVGIETLRGTGTNPLMAYMDRGPHGGYHGHEDKLNLVLYGQGRELMSDFGSVSFANELVDAWLRRSVAHNTISLAEKGQNRDVETLSSVTARYDTLDGINVLAVKPANGVFPENPEIERTLLKVAEDYVVVLDSIANAPPPIDITWHGFGRFTKPNAYLSTQLQSEWQNATSGYQFFQAPRLHGTDDAPGILQVPNQPEGVDTVWNLSLGVTDTMDDITLWYGDGILSPTRSQGAYSQRFLAIPNRTATIGKDLTHPDLTFDDLTRLEFDIFTEDENPDTPKSAWVTLQDPNNNERRSFSFELGEPNSWQHVVLDLTNPDSVRSNFDNRHRFEISIYLESETMEDAFFVFVDNIQAFRDGQAETPLPMGLATHVATQAPAKHLLADAPTLRRDEYHATQITRIDAPSAQIATLLEIYAYQPQWSISRQGQSRYVIHKHNERHILEIDPEAHRYTLARFVNDAPKQLILLNRRSGKMDNIEITADTPIELQLDVVEQTPAQWVIRYQTADPETSFRLDSQAFSNYSQYTINENQPTPLENAPITLPGGTHQIQFAAPATPVHNWSIY